MKDFFVSLLNVAGITFFRFRPVPRMWCVWLVAVNLACVFHLGHVEGQVVFVVSIAAVLVQVVLHQRLGFVRLLGVAHVLWLPMLAWLAMRAGTISTEPSLQAWVVALAATNIVSLIVDGIDVTRYIRGERLPHYSWS